MGAARSWRPNAHSGAPPAAARGTAAWATAAWGTARGRVRRAPLGSALRGRIGIFQRAAQIRLAAAVGLRHLFQLERRDVEVGFEALALDRAAARRHEARRR